MIELLTASIGTLAFGILFNVQKKHLFHITLGGFLAYAFFLIFSYFIDGTFIPTLYASFMIALYAEILARTLHAPSTPFFAVSIIPLIPGRSLYYAMSFYLMNNHDLGKYYANQTFSYALGIACGMSIMWALCDLSRKLKK